MPDVIDLSTLGNKQQEDEVALDYDDLSEEERANLDQMAEGHNPQPDGEKVRTAFLVVVGKDGTTVAVPDLDYKVIRDELPDTDSMLAAMSVVINDITVQKTAQVTAQFMQQMAMHAQQQMANQKIASQLNLR